MSLILNPVDPVLAAWAKGFRPVPRQPRAVDPRRQRQNAREADKRRRYARIIAAHEFGHQVDRELLAQALADREDCRQRVRRCKERNPHAKERACHYTNLYRARKAIAAGVPLTDTQRAAVMAEVERHEIDQTAADAAKENDHA